MDCWLCFQKEAGGHVGHDNKEIDDSSHRDGDRSKVRKRSNCLCFAAGWNFQEIEMVVYAS